MTDIATPTVDLGTFEGLAVRRAGVEVPSAAGGLREALKIDPRILHQGEEGYLVIKYRCQKVRFDPIDKDDPGGDQERVHVLSALAATFIDDDLVEARVAEHQEKVKRAKAAEKGNDRLGTDEEVAILRDEHGRGDHADERRGACPECDAELEAEREESEDPAA